MGYDSVGWSIAGRVSRHNSEDDEIDDQLWGELIEELRAVVNQKKYERLGLV